MLVKSKPGTRCPKEGKPREYITGAYMQVPASAYYRRLVAEGSLIAGDNITADDGLAPESAKKTKGNRPNNRPANEPR